MRRVERVNVSKLSVRWNFEICVIDVTFFFMVVDSQANLSFGQYTFQDKSSVLHAVIMNVVEELSGDIVRYSTISTVIRI